MFSFYFFPLSSHDVFLLAVSSHFPTGHNPLVERKLFVFSDYKRLCLCCTAQMASLSMCNILFYTILWLFDYAVAFAAFVPVCAGGDTVSEWPTCPAATVL